MENFNSFNDRKFFGIIGALSVMSLLLIAFVITAQWLGVSPVGNNGGQPTVSYNANIPALAPQRATLIGTIESFDMNKHVLVIQDSQSARTITVNVVPSTVLIKGNQLETPSMLTKGKMVSVLVMGDSIASTQPTALRIDLYEQGQGIPLPAASF